MYKKNRFKFVSSVIAGLGLLILLLGNSFEARAQALAQPLEVAHAAGPVENCTQWHNIVVGDTLAKIGRKYGVGWRVLAEMNKLANPNLIFAGTRLCIKTSADPSNAPTPTPTARPPIKIPTFTIDAVVRDQSVTITTADFPARDTFEVRMGAFGTRGVNGVKVDTIGSGSGGSFTETFDLPASLKGSRLIAIRLESPTSGYFSYNWFFNTTWD